MDLIYLDSSMVEVGMLQDFTLDQDVAGEMDFELKLSAKDVILGLGYYWYIPDTEYGGKIDSRQIDSESNIVTYTGRTWRGILDSYIVEPPSGSAYRTLTGTMSGVTSTLLSGFGISSLCSCETNTTALSSFQVDRYATLYKTLTKAAKSLGLSLGLTCSDGIVLSYHAINDYSGSVEYSQDGGLQFRLIEQGATLNHLVCLGSGELVDRMVRHLYRQADGTTGTTKYYTGVDEVAAVLDYPNAESEAELLNSGNKRMDETANSSEFEIRIDDLGILIDDIVAARDRITGMTMKGAVTNIIVKIQDGRVTQDYTIGGLAT